MLSYVSKLMVRACSFFSYYRDKGHPTQSTKLELNGSQEEDEQEENVTDNKELLTKTPPESDENDEGNYEELVCLVRQFYVERPINPSAIGHQNIETC